MSFFRSLSRAALLGVAILFALSALGCASERPPINRVQADALAKSFFVGPDIHDPSDDPEFYFRTTVIDAQGGAGSEGLFTSSDAQPMSRVRFEITEKLLMVRLSYALIDDFDYKGAKRTTQDGQVVASYTIEKHFDIRRDYNAQTGEESNIIVENDTDRPWYDREYMRVDWSKNLITDAYDLDTQSELGIYGVTWDPVSYTVNDPSNPDAPVFDVSRGYFDVTNKAYAKPVILNDPEFGPYPSCWDYGHFPTESCDNSEIKLRQSYLQVVDHDYEPIDYDGVRMDLFGYFTDDRFGYDRRYGVVDDKWHRFAARWNIYDKSHVDPMIKCNTPETTPLDGDPHRDLNGDGTEDECAKVGHGSRCDEFRGECTIPMRYRTIKTIPWHVNPDFPEELFESTSQALDGWSEAIRVAVVAARLTECRRTHGTGCEAEMKWPVPWSDNFSPPLPAAGATAKAYEVPKVMVLCHNPVDPKKGDDVACGDAGTIARLGDLRFNFVNMVNEPQITSPWGIMVDAEDPLTGEKVQGSVNQWGAVLDRAASTLVDLLGLINGNIDPEKYIVGQNVSEWVHANQPGGKVDHGIALSKDEIDSRKAAFDPKVLQGLFAGLSKENPRDPPAVRHQKRLQALTDAGRLGPGNGEMTARLNALRGTPMETKLVSPEMAQAAGYDPTGPVSHATVDRASPFWRMNPSVRHEEERQGRLSRSQRHSCRLEEDIAPDNLLGLAKEAAKLFPAPNAKNPKAVNEYNQKILLWARQKYNQGVFAHEMGHSMGLRHNFTGSFDSLNYRSQYWQLRTNNGTVTEPCKDGNQDGAHCIGPRWNDPLTQDEIDNNIGRYSATTVMDYPGDQNHDQLLQGKYDKAAMRFGYGNVVDVWDEPGVSVKPGSPKRDQAYFLTAFTSNPGLTGIFYFPPTNPKNPSQFIHYTQYNNAFKLIHDCKADSSADAIMGKKCEEAPLDIVDYRDMSDFWADPSYQQFAWASNERAVDGKGRVRRGYMFSSDEFSDTGNVPSFTYDSGADAYEQIRFMESAYENRYIVDMFRRNRVQFNSWDTISRLQSHYLDNLQLVAKTFAFTAVLDGDPANPTTDFLQDGNGGALAMGGTVALDLFARMLTRPDPGYYFSNGVPVGGTKQVYITDSAPQPNYYVYDTHIALGAGRYVHNDFDYGQGYWWADYQTQVGAYYEKIWAVYYLSEAFDDFIANSKEDFTDGRYKNVNFATVYPEQVRRLFANIMTGDVESYAPWVTVPEPTQKDPWPEGTLQYPTWHALTDVAARNAPSGTSVKLIDPNYAFNEQIYAMVWGAMFFPTNWSTQWIHDGQITSLAADQVSWPDNETYAFYNPLTGITYRAHDVGTEKILGAVHHRGVGARMLEWANNLVVMAYKVQHDAIDPTQVLYDKYGAPLLEPDVDGHPQLDTSKGHAGSDAVLQAYVEQIDIFRQLTSTFNRSLTNGDLPQP